MVNLKDQLILGRANLEVYSETLLELAGMDRDILVVTSDSRGSGKLVSFAEKFPDQIVEVGIAEQTLVGVSAGLASCGKKVFATSPGCFLTARALEQIKNDVAYSDFPVNLVGISAGVSYGALGSTHHSLHDIAALRAINNIVIVVPADNHETRMAVKAAAESNSPFYLRFGKRPMPHLYREDGPFEIGRANVITEGNDIAVVACGEAVAPAVGAAQILNNEGVNVRVISMHTIKPFDSEAVIRAASECRGMITVEEHGVYGGLGEACAAVLMEEGIGVPFRRVGIPDEYTVTGSQQEIFNHYGISPAGIAGMIRSLLEVAASGGRG